MIDGVLVSVYIRKRPFWKRLKQLFLPNDEDYAFNVSREGDDGPFFIQKVRGQFPIIFVAETDSKIVSHFTTNSEESE